MKTISFVLLCLLLNAALGPAQDIHLVQTAAYGTTLLPAKAPGTRTDTLPDLTKQLATVCFEIHTIKPGMTRAKLVKIFQADTGGVAWPDSKALPFQQHQPFVYRGSQLIKIDVEFAPSDSKEALPTDIITKISKPYLDDSPRV